MNSKIASIAVAVATVLAAGGALADKGGHGHGKHGKHHGHDNQVVYFDSNVATYNGPTAYTGCPPGLAKKGNGCLPPGQAKKLQRQPYVVGQRLPSGYTYVPVQRNVLVTLPPVQPGYQYVRVGNDILLLQPGGLIANILNGIG